MKVKLSLILVNIATILSFIITGIFIVKPIFFPVKEESLKIIYGAAIFFSSLTGLFIVISIKMKIDFIFPASGKLLIVENDKILMKEYAVLRSSLKNSECLYGIIPTRKQKIFNFVFRRSLTTNGSEIVDNCEKLSISKSIKELIVNLNGQCSINELVYFIEKKEIPLSSIDVEWFDKIPYFNFKRVFMSYYEEEFKKLNIDNFTSILREKISDDFSEYFPDFEVKIAEGDENGKK